MSIVDQRMKVCLACPLYSSQYGGMCNDKLWLNPNTGDIRTSEKYGYKRGCGCVLKFKVNNIQNSCPLEKW